MTHAILAILSAFSLPAERGILETAGLYLFRVTAISVADNPKLLGNTTFRVGEVLIGPGRLKGTESTYKFFTPRSERSFLGGSQYSGKYPDFAFPTAKDQSRYWWAMPSGKDGWKTANFYTVGKFLPPPGPELLLKTELKADSKEAKQQAELLEAILALESKRTLLSQIKILRKLQESENAAVYSMADRTLSKLTTPQKEK